MFDLTCLIHGPDCTDIFHILFVIIVGVLGLALCVFLFFFLFLQIEAIICDRSRVQTMFETYYRDRCELNKLRQDLDRLLQEVQE